MKASRIGEDYICLEWRPPKNDGGAKITKYIIKKRKDKKDEWERVMTVDGYQTSFKVTSLTKNVGYYFNITAENKVGVGKPCETVGAIITQREASKYVCFIFVEAARVISNKMKCYFRLE